VPTGSPASAETQLLLPPAAPRVRITTGKGLPAEKSWNLRRPITLIGSRRTAHILLRHPEVSKAHCVVVNTGQHIMARDLNSRTGILINGQPIRLAELHHGDGMKIGAVVIDFAIQRAQEPPQFDPARMPFKAMFSRKDSSEQWAMTEVISLIGRKPGCDLLLDHEDVSLAHAILCAIDGEPVAFDLGSRTGTWLNGQRVQLAQLRSGDTLRVGPFELVVALDHTDRSLARGPAEGRPADSAGFGAPQTVVPYVPVDPAGADRDATDLSEPIEDEAVPLEYDGASMQADTGSQEIVIQAPNEAPASCTSQGDDSLEKSSFNPESLITDLEQNIAVLQQNMAQSAQRVGEWQKRLHGRAAQLDDREKELNQREEVLGVQQQELETAQAELDHRRAEVLEEIELQRQQLADAQADIAAKREELVAQSQQIEAWKAELQAERQKIDGSRAEVEAERQALGNEREAFKSAAQEYQQQQQALDAARSQLEKDREELTRQRAAAEEEIKGRHASLETARSQLEQDRAELARQRAAAEEEIKGRHASLETARSQLEQDRAELARQRAAAEEEIKGNRAAQEATSAHLDQQRQELEARISQHQNEAKALMDARQQIEEASGRLEARAAELDRRQAELAQQQAAIQQQAARVQKDLAAVRKQAALIQQIQSALAQANAVFSVGPESVGSSVQPSNREPDDTNASAHGAPDLDSYAGAAESQRGDQEPPPDVATDTANDKRQGASVPSAAPAGRRPRQQSEPAQAVRDVKPVGPERGHRHPPASAASQAEAPDKPKRPVESKPSDLKLDAETLENIRMLRRLGAKGTDEELLAQLTAKHKQKGKESEESGEAAKKKHWWSR
jgi:pSer/pThr/pTyr-binding forkhead associated (FHA) protein/predicted  nucleic acid-binding Zn-ribbon protein